MYKMKINPRKYIHEKGENMKKIVKILIIIILLNIITFKVNAQSQNKIVEENGYKYYYENNQKVTGFKETDGKIYFFSNDKTRYGAMRTGMLLIGDTAYYFSPEAKTGWFEYNGNKYYANEKGEILNGYQQIDGKYYFLSNDKTKYGAMRTGMLLIGDTAYCLNPDAKTGWFEYNGNKYYANEKGEILNGYQEIDGKYYFFSNDKTRYGAMRTGMLLIGDTAYCLNPDAKTGLFEYEKNKYYANEKGEIQIGFQVIENKTYFFSRSKEIYGQMKVGFQEIDGSRYFFSQAKEMYGQMRTGWIQIYENQVYLNKDGTQCFGFTEIDGNTYFFSRDRTKYGAMVKGWINYDNYYYYFDENGIMQTGKQNIENRDYEFDATGKLQGFKTINGKLYYYNPDGSIAKGVQRIAGRYHKFNELTGTFEKFVNQKIVIDISSHNGVVDWEKVKNSGKVDAVILRLGYGVGYMDTQFLNNVRELNRLGIPYSVYLFSYAENGYESELEANFVVNTIKNNPVYISSNLFGIYYDLEDWTISSTGDNSYGISQNAYREMITAFDRIIQQNLGIKSRVYASKNYIETRFPEDVRAYATWVAQWGSQITYTGPYEGWQYTSDGSIPGINGRVDMSIFYY